MNEYYTKASTGPIADRVCIPLLAFGAKDDPICASEAIPHAKCSDHSIFATTEYGGHIAHLELNSFRAESFIDKVGVAFIEATEQWLEFKQKSR